MARTKSAPHRAAKGGTNTIIERIYEPRGGAYDAIEWQGPELLFSGPAGTGKSRALLEKMHNICLHFPNVRALMVRKTMASLGSTALVTWREHVVADHLADGTVKFFGGSPQYPAQYQYNNGSTVTVGGMDKAMKIMSSEYDVCYVQEATELTILDWEAITTRLRNGKMPWQQIMADCNPDTPNHWLKQRCDEGRCKMIYSLHTDNPVLYNADKTMTPRGEAYIAKLDALTGVRRDRLYLGKWVAAEGQVYEEFNYERHAIDGWENNQPPQQWERYWTVDFGYTNPFVLQCWAVDPDGRLYLYREIYRSQTLVEDHARAILQLVRHPGGGWKEPKPRAIICDHDAEDRATLEKHLGLGTLAATKTVSDGIQCVQDRMRVQKDGKPRIFFARNAVVKEDNYLIESAKPTSTLAELPGYVWDTTTSANAVNKNARETPMKKDDHGMDAMRYMVAYLDIQGLPRLRWIS